MKAIPARAAAPKPTISLLAAPVYVATGTRTVELAEVDDGRADVDDGRTDEEADEVHSGQYCS